jgi:phosphohistidine phosphatase
MQRLVLMRHARAGAAAAGRDDHERDLTEDGRLDAARVGRALAARGFSPDRALVSDARRTHQTWDLASESFGDVDARIDAALYDASAQTLRGLVEACEDEAGCLMVVAHNPGVHQLAVDYLTDGAASPAVIDRLTAGFPPGAAALFQVDVAGRALFHGLILPGELSDA